MGKDGDPGGQATSSKDPKMQAAKVRLLDGTYKEFELHRGSDGEALFALVSADLSIEEREYFSLCFYDNEGTRHWLYNDKKILRQLKGLPWEFCYEVKFYPTVPSSLNDDHARYNLFLQLRNDVCTGRLPATLETHATLGSLVAQAEFGDAKPTPEYEQYLRSTKFAPQMSDQLIEMIAQKHKEHKGLTPSEAENLYLDTCKQQTMYGIFVFNAKDSKNAPVGIGICAHGIYIYKDQIRVNRFPWQGIIKISYRKNQFAIKLKAGEIDKKEATVTYKVADYQAAKRIWKCAVEHHTFFRLIQPDEKPKSSLFRWGSARFRYQGRTQFQTKMASQMFDKPSTVAVQRASNARLTHSLDNVAHPQTASEQVSPLHYADNELGREPMASPAVSYEVSGQNEKRKLDDKVGAGLPSDDDELVYTPVESPSSAAYYLSERSSAYSPNSNDYPYTQQMRSAADPYAWKSSEHDRSTSAVTSSGGAGRVYYPGTGETFSGTRSLPKDSSVHTKSSTFDTIEKRAEMQPHPIHDTVHVYHPGHYQDLRQHRQQQAAADPNLNGVTPMRSLGPDGEMDRHPIRYFVDVHHSGSSQIPQISRIRHPGKEEVGPPILSSYVFSKKFATPDAPMQRLEPLRELPSHNIRAYSAMYHHGSSHEDDIPNVRLIARVIPRTPSQENLRPERDFATTSMETSSKKRLHEESPKTSKHTKKKLKKEEKKEATALKGKESPEKRAVATTSSGVTTRVLSEKQGSGQPEEGKAGYSSTSRATRESPHKEVKSVRTDVYGDTSGRVFLSGGWRHEGEEHTVEKEHVRPESYGLPSTSYGGPLETTSHQRDLEPAPLGEHAKPYHPGQSWKESKTVKTIAVQPGSVEHEVKGGREEVSTGQFGSDRARNEAFPTFTTRWGRSSSAGPEEEEHKVRLIALVRPKSEEEEEPEVKKPKKEKESSGLFGFWKGGKKKSLEAQLPPDERPGPSDITSPAGPLDTTSRQKDIEKTPIPKVPPPVPYKPTAITSETSQRTQQQTVVKQTGPVESIDRQKDLEKTPVKVPPPVPYKPSSLVTETPRRTQEETVKTVVRQTGPLDTTKPEKDMEKIPIQVPTPVEYKPSKEVTDTTRTTHRTHHLFGRWRHEGEEETIGKDRVRAYGLPTTSYQGPLEHTKRIGDLEPSPLWEYTKAYHPGESWNDPNYHKKPALPPVASERTKKKAVLHLRSAEKDKEQAGTDEEDEHKVRLIARVPHGAREEESYAAKGEEESADKSRRGFLFGRWRHEGDEETVDKARVRPDTYHIRTDPYQGPLDTTTRISELEPKPLWDYSQAYHSGQSWDDGGSRLWGTKETKEAKPSTSTSVAKETTEKRVESEHPEGKTATLHLKKTPMKKSSSAESEEETRKVRLIARVVHRDTSEDEAASRSSKDKESSGLFGFFKGGKSKRHEKGEPMEESHLLAEKYTGPLDTVDRQKDIDKLPFNPPPPVPYKPKSGGTEHEQHAYKPSAHVTETTHRPQLFGRWRHEGDEETVEKDKVRTETYGLPVGPYSGPLESTSRHSELDPTPLREHAKAYHSGQSWDTTKVTHGEAEPTGKTATSTVTESKTVLHKRSPVKEKHSPITNEEEAAKVRLIALVCPADEQRESHLKEVENERAKAGVTDVPKVLEEHRQGHTDKQSPHISETKTRHGFLFGRWRHEGDEETVEKDRVRTETYGLKTTPYTGPLESTTRSSELDPKPLWDYSQAYHSGQSWDTGKTKTPSAQSASKEKEPGLRKAVLHLKTTGKEKSPSGIEEEETRRVKLIALVPPKPEDEAEISTQSKAKDHESSGLFGFFKKGKSKQHAVQKEGSPTQYPTTEQYAGPLDNTQRHKDIDQLPFKAPATVAYKPTTEESDITQPGHLFGRWRHEGEEETVDKSKVRPETYVTSTTQHTGPLDSTQRQPELEPTPLQGHAQVYHSGQSWETGKGTKAVAAQSIPRDQEKSEKERTTERTAVLHLKGSDVKEKSSPTIEEETRRIRLIARVRRSDDDELDTSKSVKETKHKTTTSPGFTKGKGESFEARIEKLKDIAKTKPQEAKREITTSPGYTKVEGESYEAHIGKPKTPEIAKTGRHPRLFGRWRHEGEEETVEKEHVLPGGYVMPATSYQGPLESTSRESELQPAPLKDYAKAYHSGQSWDPIKGAIHDVEVERRKIDEQIGGVEAGSPGKSGTERTTGKTTIVHTKTSEKEQKRLPEEAEEETRRIRLIARVVPDTPEDEVVLRKKSKDKEKESPGLFGFLKGKRKGREADESHVRVREADEPHISTEKYTGPLDKIDPQKDMEKLPLEVTPPVPAPRRTSAEAPRVPDRAQAFGRWRHEGEEETVEKERVNRDKYGLPSTSYQGPLESTTRISELEPAPLRDYAQAYHHGQSWDVSKGTKGPATQPIEREEGTGKKALLHLKKSPVKERTSPLPDEEEERKVRLIALVRKTSDEDRDVAERKKEHGKSSPSKYRESELHKERTEKTSGTITETSPKRGHLFGRWRHEGEEETVEKGRVLPESYGTTTGAYSGPLDSITPESDLEKVPIGEHASVYHPGQSWDDKGKKAPIVTDVKERVDETGETDRKAKEKAVIHLKAPKEEEHTRTTSEEETRKIRLIARVPHSRSEEDADYDKSSQERGSSSVFSFWKKKEGKNLEKTEAIPRETVEKYEGPVDKINPQKDIDKLPFKAPPPVPYKPKLKGERAEHAYEPTSHDDETTHRHPHLFGRWRHEGEEETVDKDKVRTDTYNLPSGHYEGPLDSTTRQSELEPTPLGEHAQAYHSGQSWNVTKEMKTPMKEFSGTAYGKESIAKKKSSKEKTPEYDEDVRKVRLIALVRPGEPEDLDVKKPKKEKDVSRPPRPLKEEEIRQQQAAAKSKETSSWLPSLFGRSRHEGEEDVVEKGKVRPESYHTSTTTYEGPLDSTTRGAELEPTPLRDFSQAYHSGQSWDDKGAKVPAKPSREQQEKGVSETSGTVPQVKDYEKSPDTERKAVLHLKTTGKAEPSAPPLEETDDERKVRLIALVRHTNDEDDAEQGKIEEARKPKKEQESGGLFGFWKSKSKKPEETTEEYHPSSTKFTGPLDEIDREKDIEKLPFKAPPPVPYKPKSLRKQEAEQPEQAAKTPSPDKTRTTSRPPQLFGRWRHEGDEETIDKDKVRSETYGRSAVPYDGPLDETSRQSELDHTPLQEHAHAYHPGQSWNDSRGGKILSGHEHPGPTRGVLHLDASPGRETEEERKIRLIARVKHEGDDDQESAGHLDLRPAGLSEVDTHPTRTAVPQPQEQELHLKSSPPEKRPPSLMTDAEEARIARLIARSKDHGTTRSSGITRMGSGERSSAERDSGDRSQKESSPIYRSLIGGRDPAEKGFDTGHTTGERSTGPRLPDPPRREYTGSLVSGREHTTAHGRPEPLPRDYGTSAATDRERGTAYRSPDRTQREYTTSSVERERTSPYRSMVGDVTRESEYPTRHTAVTATFWKRTITTNSGSNIVESYQSNSRRSPGREPNLVLETSRPFQPTDSYSERGRDAPAGMGVPPGDPPPAYSYRPDDKDQHPEGAETSGYVRRPRAGSYSVCGKDEPAMRDTLYDRDGASAETSGYTRPRTGSYSVCGKDEPAIRDTLYDPNATTAEAPDYGRRARSGSYSMCGKDEPAVLDTTIYDRVSATNDYRLAPYPDSGRRPVGGHIYDYREPGASGSYAESRGDQSSTMDTSSDRPRAVATESYRFGSDSPSSRERPAEGATASPSGSGHLIASSSSARGRSQGTTQSGDEYVEVHVDRRAEIQLEPAFCLTGAGLSELAENEDGFVFSVTPPPMPSSERSFFSRIFKSSSKKSKKQKKTDKGVREADSSDSSSESEDEKNQVHIMPVESGDVTLPLYKDPEDKDGKVVRRETNELKYHLKGEGVSPGFDPQNPESGQPHTTISTWQESNRLPDEVTTEYDEKGNKITRTLKTSQVKHTVQKQTFQNYVVPTDGQPGVVSVERVREETTPLGTTVAATTNGTNGSAGSPHVVETHSRTVAYEADPHHETEHNEGLGEFVSCKTLTSGNRTVETYTYKTERDGIIETHVEHRVTIHSDEPIDHDAELTHAIMEATQMNPDMTVEKIEVRQESTA